MGLFTKLISKILPTQQAKTTGVLEDKERKFDSITLGDADYRNEELKQAYAPVNQERDDEELIRLMKLAAKTKNNRIKKKLHKRINTYEQ